MIQQIGRIAALNGLTLIGGTALLDFELLTIPESEGFYFTGPELHFEHNVNETTGRSGGDLVAAYKEKYNEAPTSVYMAHAYDAATILLRAIEEVAVVSGDTLYIDRARLRAALTDTTGFGGMVGALSCDAFGDCGAGRLHILHHTDTTVSDIGSLPIVYFHRPEEHRTPGH